MVVTLLLAVPAPVLATRRRWWQGIAILGGGVLVLLLVAQLLFDAGTIVPVANPLLALLVTGVPAVLYSLIVEVRARAIEAGAARQRALDAGDEARHRIERDLHDGAQQRLLALAMTLSAPSAHSDPKVLQGSVAEIRETLTELRALTRGANPAVLDELGLSGALRSLADSSPVPTTLRVDNLDSLPPAVGRAVYLITAEALSNVIKHAGASRLLIEATHGPRGLSLVVADDGRGGASTGGSGLSGLQERASVLGGSLSVTSPPGGGTTITAELPC